MLSNLGQLGILQTKSADVGMMCGRSVQGADATEVRPSLTGDKSYIEMEVSS
jgi:hypothetical protein